MPGEIRYVIPDPAIRDDRYFVGLDIGQVQDYSAAAIVRQRCRLDDKHDLIRQYKIVYLHRYPLGTQYTAVVEDWKDRFQRDELRVNGKLIPDMTGVGRPVLELLRKAELPVIGVNITGGNEVSDNALGFNVPKADLIGALQVMLQNGSLKAVKGLPFWDEFVAELEHFREKQTARTVQYGADMEQIHDDLVIAVAMPVWYAWRQDKLLDHYIGANTAEEDEKRNHWNPLTRR